MRKVIFISSGSVVNGQIFTSPFVQSQANSLAQNWKVLWGLTKNTNAVGFLKSYFEVKSIIKSENPVIIHAQYGSMTAFFAWLIKGDQKLVVSFCGDDILGTPIHGWLWRIRSVIAKGLSDFAANRSHHIIVKSKEIQNEISDKLQQKLSLIPNGVNVDLFYPIDRVEACQQLGLKPDKNYILFNESRGNNKAVKNYVLAKAVVEIVNEAMPHTELLIIGNVSPQEVPLYVNSCCVVLLTSLHEGSPNIVKEAMACNVPIVSVPCGDVKERITDDSIGYVCNYDADELADKIILVLKNNRRTNGRDHLLKQGLSTDQVKEKIEAVYNKVLMS